MNDEKGGTPLLRVEGLKKYFPIQRGVFKQSIGETKAVDDVNLFIMENEVLGLVGESGCGKSTLGRTILRVYEPTDGKVIYNFGGEDIDFFSLNKSELRAFRKNMQLIFQDPYNSLNPRMSVFEIIAEPMRISGETNEKKITEKVKQLISKVGLEVKQMNRYPSAFSGGQRQRIGIARALSLDPKFIVADEAVSALDVSLQAQILNLLQDLQDEMSLTFMFISHDLSVVEHICDTVCVMYLGKVVEQAKTNELFFSPKHPYTEALIAAIPLPVAGRQPHEIILKGEISSSIDLPQGCPFHPRCLYAEKNCAEEVPSLKEVGKDHFVSCHRAKEIQLQGIS